jgi:hypothetical protein
MGFCESEGVYSHACRPQCVEENQKRPEDQRVLPSVAVQNGYGSEAVTVQKNMLYYRAPLAFFRTLNHSWVYLDVSVTHSDNTGRSKHNR